MSNARQVHSEPSGDVDPATGHVIFRALLVGSQDLVMVEYPDHQLGILVNGKPIPPHPWPASRLGDCIDRYRELCRRWE